MALEKKANSLFELGLAAEVASGPDAAGLLWSRNIDLFCDGDDLSRILQHCLQADQNGISSAPLSLTASLVYLDGGEQFMDRGSTLHQAIVYAQKAIAVDPNCAEAYRMVGSAYYWMNDHAQALHWYIQSNELEPHCILQLRIRECAQALGQGLPDISYGMKFDSTSAHWHHAGWFYEQGLGADKLLKLSPAVAPVATLQTIKQQCYARCVELYKACLIDGDTSHPNFNAHQFAMCCNNYGILLREAGQPAEAIALHSMGIAQSQFWEQYYSRSLCYYDMRQYQACFDDLEYLLTEFETEEEQFIICIQYQAYCQRELGNYERAIALVDEALNAYGEFTPAGQRAVAATCEHLRGIRGALLLQVGELDQGAHALAQTAATQKDPVVLHNLGCAHLRQRAFKEAVQCFTESYELALRRGDLATFKAAAYSASTTLVYELSKHKAALSVLRLIEQQGVDDFWTQYATAMAYCFMENRRLCKEYSLKALSMQDRTDKPIDGSFLGNLYNNVALGYHNESNWTQAKVYYELTLPLSTSEDAVHVQENLRLIHEEMNKPKGFWSRFFG